MNVESFKVIYKDRVLNPINVNVIYGSKFPSPDNVGITKPKFLEITFVDEDGEISVVNDEAFMFKFVRR